MYRARVDGTGLERLGTFPTVAVTFSPDLSRVAYRDQAAGAAGAAGPIRIVDLATGQTAEVPGQGAFAWRPAAPVR